MTGVSLSEAQKAKSKVAKIFSPLVGVVAVGITRTDDDNYGLKVNLTSPPGDEVILPTDIDGVPVQVEVVGKIRKR